MSPIPNLPGLFHPRESWEYEGERVADGDPPPQRSDEITAGVIHYSAAQDPPDDRDTTTANWLAKIQHDYLTHRGYSIGYLWCVDPRGGCWALRGFDYMSAANGAASNPWTAPILMTTGLGEPATDAAWAAVRAIYAEHERRSQFVWRPRPYGHGQLDGAATACPGAALLEQLDAGLGDSFHGTEPPELPEPPTLEIMFLYRHLDYADTFAVGAGALHLGPGLFEAFTNDGVPLVTNSDANELDYVCRAANWPVSALKRL